MFESPVVVQQAPKLWPFVIFIFLEVCTITQQEVG